MSCFSSTRLLEVLGSVLCLLVFVSKPAHAYVDPGTGSFVLQAAVAGILAAVFVVKSTWRSIMRTLSRLFVKRAQDDD